MFWHKKKPIAERPRAQHLPEVTIQDGCDSHSPEMKRSYRASLSGGRWIQATFRNSWRGGREATAMLHQSDYIYVFFNIDRVADEVLDPALVPEVQKFATEIRLLDTEWALSDPNRYIDSEGITWQRVEKT